MENSSHFLPTPGQIVQPGEGWHRQVAMPLVGIVLDIISPSLINVLWRYSNGTFQVHSLNPIYLDLDAYDYLNRKFT